MSKHRSSTILLLAALSAGSFYGCSSGPFSVHKLEIQQGNALDEEQVEQVEVGMDTSQVRYLLGNPLVTDGFHANRWDYVYYLKQDGKPAERRRLTLYFKDGEVVEITRPNGAQQQAERG